MKKQRIKKYVYDPFTKYVLFLLPLGMTALAFVFCIFGVRYIINNEIGEGIVILCTAILSIIVQFIRLILLLLKWHIETVIYQVELFLMKKVFGINPKDIHIL